MNKEKWIIINMGCAIVIIVATFLGVKHIQFQADINKASKNDISKLHGIQGKNNLELLLRIKKLEDKNKKQQKIIDKMDNAMFGEEKIGENSG